MNPTRLLVISDSHGGLGTLLPHAPWSDADHFLFAGDGYDEAATAFRRLGVWDRTVAVAGNCDNRPAFAEAEFTLAGCSIWLTHGDRWHVKSGCETIAAEARRRGHHLVVFGHSHRATYQQIAGVHAFNPGSPIAPRGGTAPSMGWIELHAGTPTCCHLQVFPNGVVDRPGGQR